MKPGAMTRPLQSIVLSAELLVDFAHGNDLAIGDGDAALEGSPPEPSMIVPFSRRMSAFAGAAEVAETFDHANVVAKTDR